MSQVEDNNIELTIDVKEITNNAVILKDPDVKALVKFNVEGDGFFDDLMETATKHLYADFKNGFLVGEQYATARVEVMIALLQSSLNLWLQKPLIEAQIKAEEAKVKVYEAQAKMYEKQEASEQAKADLYIRQTAGYDDHLLENLQKNQSELYGMMFSVAKNDPNLIIPEFVKKDDMDSLFQQIKARIK